MGEQKLVVRLAHQERPTAGSTRGCIWRKISCIFLMVKQDNEMSNWPYPRIVAHRGGGKLAPKTPWRQSTSGQNTVIR